MAVWQADTFVRAGGSYFQPASAQLDAASFYEQLSKYEHSLELKHATIVDALNGQRYDVFEQMLPIDIDVSSRGSESADRLQVY